MTQAIKELFGKFPRAVGNPRQSFVHSWHEFEDYVAFNNGNNNVYSSISHYSMQGHPLCDKVSLDFDSPLKEAAFGDTTAEDVKIERMRSESNLAEEVMGEVMEDVKKVCRWTIEQSIPTVIISTGFGFHLHMLFRTEINPVKELTSTAVMLKEELDIETLDRVPIGDIHRIMRVPNCERMDGDRRCNHFTIPLTPQEMCEKSIHEILDLSLNPRIVEIEGDRKEMQVYEGYTRTTHDNVSQKPIEGITEGINEELEEYVRSILQMPCVSNRILQPDPSHKIRMQACILFFNVGLSPQEVTDIFQVLDG